MTASAHGHLLAGEVGEIVGVSGTTIGQWARHGYVRPSRSAALPHVYGVEDVGEASLVAGLLSRGVRHADVRGAIARLASLGPWPLSAAEELATTAGDGRPRVLLREGGQTWVLGPRGWQQAVVAPAHVPVRLRLHPPG